MLWEWKSAARLGAFSARVVNSRVEAITTYNVLIGAGRYDDLVDPVATPELNGVIGEVVLKAELTQLCRTNDTAVAAGCRRRN